MAFGILAAAAVVNVLVSQLLAIIYYKQPVFSAWRQWECNVDDKHVIVGTYGAFGARAVHLTLLQPTDGQVAVHAVNELQELEDNDPLPSWSMAGAWLHGEMTLPSVDNREWLIIDAATGWPLQSMGYRATAIFVPGDLLPAEVDVSEGIPLGSHPESWFGLPGVAPMAPIAVPFMVNTLFFAFLIGAGILFWQRHRLTPLK